MAYCSSNIVIADFMHQNFELLRHAYNSCVNVSKGRIKELYKLSNGKYIMPAPLEDMVNRQVQNALIDTYV